MTDAPELLPCPFCGCPEPEVDYGLAGAEFADGEETVICPTITVHPVTGEETRCGASMLGIAMWNRRANLSRAAVTAAYARAAELVRNSQVAYTGDGATVEPARDPGASPAHNAIATAILALADTPAGPDPRVARLVEAAKALQADMLDRGYVSPLDGVKTVSAGRTVWFDFCAALAAMEPGHA